MVGIVQNGCPYFIGVILLQYADTVFVVIVQVEIGDVELTVILYYEDGVITLELAEVFSAAVIIEAQYITVKPYFASTQGGASTLFQCDLVNGKFRQDVSHSLPSLDIDGAKVLFKDNTPYTRVRFQCYFDDFGLAVWIGGEIGDARVGGSLGYVVFTVTHYAGHGKTFDVAGPFFPVTVAYVVDGTFVILLEYVGIKDVFAHELLVGNRSDDVFPVPEENNYVVDR